MTTPGDTLKPCRWRPPMQSVREHRAVATAALQAWKAAQSEPTMTNAELKRLKRTADAAHDTLMNAIADSLGGAYVVRGE